MGTGQVGLQGEGCGPGGVAWMLCAGPTPSGRAVCLAFMSFRLTHPRRANAPSLELLSAKQLRLSCDSAPKGLGPNIWGMAPSIGQRRASLLSAVDPRHHLLPSLQKKKRGEGILTTWMVQHSFWKLKGPKSSSTGVHVGREGAWSRAALGPREKSIGVKIEGRSQDFQGGATEQYGSWGAQQRSWSGGGHSVSRTAIFSSPPG